jgi:putative flavoprotein involved in K+ transport
MELNVWTGAELVVGTYDDETGIWTLHVRPDGAETRELNCAHVVLATGTLDAPIIPEIKGMDTYRGLLYHSSRYASGEDHTGRRAVVIGAGVSAHDVSQDLHDHGAEVTMIQRSEIYVVSQKHGIPAIFGGIYYEGGPPLEEADLLNAAYPWHLSLELGKAQTEAIAELDRDLLDGLEAAGFKLGYGVNGAGLMSLALRRSGGFYIDVGCSQLIVDGAIKMRGSGVDHFTETGVVLADGTEIEASIVVMATGYTGMRNTARRLFGDELGDRVRDVWNLDEESELRTIWRDSGHPGFWFMGGSLAMARVFGPALALQIAATLRGVIPHPSARTREAVA